MFYGGSPCEIVVNVLSLQRCLREKAVGEDERDVRMETEQG